MQKYALIPHTEYERLTQSSGTSVRATEHVPLEEPQVHIYGVKDDPEDNLLMNLAELLPKGYRSKARLMLHSLVGKIQLDDSSHVLYNMQLANKSVQTQRGSHIMDLGKGVRLHVVCV